MTAFSMQRLACGYFFAIPGLAYGIFTARMPALKAMVKANDTDIGFLLLAFGATSFLGLSICRYAIVRYGARLVIGVSALIIPLAMRIAGFAINYWQLVSFCLLGGLASGFCEVAMNAQGLLGDGIGLDHALWVIVFLCACIAISGPALLARRA